MTADATAVIDADSRLCPRCGYDLRAAVDDRCSECGLQIDPAKLAESQLPWVHRKTVGRLRGFHRTCTLINWDAKRIRHELSRPHRVADAARFSAIMGLIVAVVLSAALLVFPKRADALNDIIQAPLNGNDWPEKRQIWKAAAGDLLSPCAIGLGVPMLVPVYFLVLGHCVVRVGIAPARRVKGEGARHAAAAESLSRYAAGPLIGWVYASLALLAGLGLTYWAKNTAHAIKGADVRLVAAGVGCFFVAAFFYVAGVAIALHRGAQWYARARRGGFFTYLRGLGELTLRACGATLIGLWLLPWCVGFLLIALDFYGQ